MKKDITSRTDTDKLVEAFYKKLKRDALLSPFFRDIADEAAFINKIKLFWQNVVFFTGSYSGNPMQLHKNIHDKTPLTPQIFRQWLYIFTTTVDEMFEGEKASFVKQRARSIATVMQVKILESNLE